VGTGGTAIVAIPLYLFLASLVPYLVGGIISTLVGILLIVTGGVLYFQRGKKGELGLDDITWKEAFLLGLVQGLAVLPGISRSGMTLTWLLVRGVRREEALRLSFILGVPATFGVVILDLLFCSVFWTLPLLIVFIVLVAFLTGFGALLTLRYSAMKVPWWIFCIALGLLVVALSIPALLVLPSIGIP
jgi:undecaprenyl-diphosphatase